MIEVTSPLFDSLEAFLETYQVVIESQVVIEQDGKKYHKTHVFLYCKIAGCDEQELWIVTPV